ncbi:MAG: Glycoside hydrolase 2 (Mannanase, beta-galactosidase) [Peltula sp. TS41687]|nr:MAG: Glycoside hydrolase 2 (Mannanase, beta-galactosidase) [Peltula sp. TS41687]
MEQQANRPHRKSKERKAHSGGPNPKAFAYANPGRLQKQAARSHDVREKRLHVPLVDRLPEEPPPLIVAVVGPPGVGKTTLIKSLIKRYTKHTLSSPTGPLTVVTSKKRRLTFLECPADSLASMIDVSKVADIVLLMIDGNFGFEMETMEFLNVLSASGMPGNIFGILTHLDLFKKPATLKQAKKRLKHRFWSELYQGAKLFYLSGVINGRYPDREIHNLSRFLSVMKNPRPLIWRNSHPYCLADRLLDLTPPTAVEENPKCDRTVVLYGYLRGINFPASDGAVHIPGVGDLKMALIESLPDPCPTPSMDQTMAKATGKTTRRRLGEKQKLLFAPMSDVGGVLVDKDAVYIDVKTSNFDKEINGNGERGFGEKLVIDLQGGRRLLGEADDGVRLFRGAEKTDTAVDAEAEEEGSDSGRKAMRRARFVEGREQSDDGPVDDQEDDEGFVSGEESQDDESESGEGTYEGLEKLGLSSDKDGLQITKGDENEDFEFADSDSDLGSISSAEDQSDGIEDTLADDQELDEEEHDDDDDEGAARWKQNLTEKAKRLHDFRPRHRTADLARMIYDDSLTPAEALRKWKGELDDERHDITDGQGSEENDEEFFRKASHETGDHDLEDRSVPLYNYKELEEKWADKDSIEALRIRFASTHMSQGLSDDAQPDGSDDGNAIDIQSEGDGAYDDLETGEKHGAPEPLKNDEPVSMESERERNAKRKEELKLRFEEEDREGFNNDRSNARREGGEDAAEEFGEDDWYDAQKAQIQKQLSVNRVELDALDEQSRVRVEGYKAGTYARIVLESVPCEFVTNFHPRYPIIIGGLTPTEERFGFVQVRIKRHRWHKKILKTNDPLIFSLGWRRFQTLPIYSISDSRTRNRMLKYTPEHMHCFGTFYGPLIAPNTGFCCVQTFSNTTPGFRIAATGVVLNVDESTEIVKKLKLTGTPYKIFRNTAFIRDMFSSALEIAKFEGASIRTVSGIRGQIKRGLSKPEGHFRATFEDKILMSDIVFLRAWYPIRPHRFYNPVTNLLEDHHNNSHPSGKDTGTGWTGMRLTGEVRAAQALPVPQAKNSRYRPIERPTRHFNPLRVPRQLAAELPFKSQIVVTKPQRKATYMQKRAVVLGGEEKKARDLMQKLMTLRNDKVAKRRAAQEERRKVYRKKVAENEAKKSEREKREREEFWRREGKKRKGRDGESGAVGKKRKT